MDARVDPPLGSRRTHASGFRIKKRWFLLPGLLALVWLAPSMIAMTPLVSSAVDSAVPELRGQIRIGGASLGWLSPVVIRNVVWRDPQGETIAEIPTLRIERSLYQLLTNRADLGTIRVQQPKVNVLLRDNGSNIEDALAPLLNKPASDSPPPSLSVVVEEGYVEIGDAARPAQWTCQQLNIQVMLSSDASVASQVDVRGELLDAGQSRKLELTYAWNQVGAEPTAGQPGGSLVLKTDQTPLAMLQPLVRRMLPGATLGGVASCDVSYAFNADRSQQRLQINSIAGHDLLLAAPQWLGSETLRSTQLSINGLIEVRPELVKLEQVQLTSDFASLTAQGQLATTALQSTLLAVALQEEDYELHGQIDIARVAAMLPATLKIRDGTQITAGVVSLDLVSRSQGKRHRWDGELKSSKLAALQDGREILWDQPITVTLAAQNSAAGPVIERLTCEASFLKLQGRGTLAQGELTAHGDLAQLQAEANRFLNLDEVRLAGTLAAELDWKLAGERDFQAQGQAQISNLVMESPGRQPWKETLLTVDLAASGAANERGLTQLNSFDIRVIAGDDQFLASLVEAVMNPHLQSTWPMRCTLRGELARWLPRVQGWLPVSEIQATGAVAVDVAIVSSPEALQVRSAKVDVTNLALQGAGMVIQEPEVRLAADGVWSYRDQQFSSEVLTMTSSAVAVRADKLTVQPRGSAVAIAGEVGYRGDLTKLMSWFQTPNVAPQQAWQGALTGRVQFVHQNNVTAARWTNEFENLALLVPSAPAVQSNPLVPVATTQSPWKTQWQEAKLAITGQGEFNHEQDQVALSALDVASDMIRLGARGKIHAWSTSPMVDLTGEVDYDLKKVTELLATLIGPGIEMAGLDKRQFFVRGPLPRWETVASQDSRTPAQSKLIWPKELVGQAAIGWKQANVYSLPVDTGSIDAALQDGVVTIAPLDLRVAEGRLKAWPRIVLNNEPMVFQLAKGTQVEQIQITPKMCETWLKFVAPLLADATQAEGKFSANLEGATLPLLAPARGDARGAITIHGARVGPGKLAEPYVLLARQMRAIVERKPVDGTFNPANKEWLTLPQQEVPVQLADGRVYHRGLQMVVGDATLVSSGSVGLIDQTVNLTIDIPIRDEWVAKDRLLSGLRGQSLKVPIGGTINKPQIDNRALQQLTGQMINNAAGGLIENELQKGLDKLFKPK